MIANKMGLMILFHCRSNTGYAIASLEAAFLEASLKIFPIDSIHFVYPDISQGLSPLFRDRCPHIAEFNLGDGDEKQLKSIENYIVEHNIKYLFGFDQPVSRPYYKSFRNAGIEKFISYYGAPASSLNGGIKLLAKRLEVYLTRHKPDHFIFESNAMVETGVKGRGISPRNVSRVYLGVDTEKYAPRSDCENYAHEIWHIPKAKKIFFYSGHMEERKGVGIIMQAAIELAEARGRDDFHFLILGNKGGEADEYKDLVAGTAANECVTFGGYRTDLPRLHNSCYAGIIASVGWDSLTMSSIEMMASGLPIIVSDLQGLKETVEVGISGYIFERGNFKKLASIVEELIDNIDKRNEFSENARRRALECFSVGRQVDHLGAVMKDVFS